MQVRDVMRPLPTPIGSHETVQLAAQRMKRENIGCLVVVDRPAEDRNERLIGIVTDRDLSVRCLVNGKNPSSMLVRDVMSVGVIYCYEDELIGGVIERMMEQGVMRLPVLDRSETLVGLLSARDSVRSVPMSKLSQRQAQQVQFTKEIVSSQGQVHQVPLQSVYVSGAEGDHRAENEAIESFQTDRRIGSWKEAADSVGIKRDD